MVKTVAQSYSVAMELESGSFTELSDDVLEFSIGRRKADLFSAITPGESEVTFDNFSGDYSPSNGAGAYAGLIKPGVKLRIEASYSNSAWPMFLGFLDEAIVRPTIQGQRRAIYRFRDQFRWLNDRSITTSLFINTDTSSIVAAVFSESGVESADIHGITDVIPFASFERRQSVGVIQQLIESGFHQTWVGPDGAAHFHSRYAGQTDDLVASYSNVGFDLDYSLSDLDVLNRISVRGEQRRATSAISSLAWIQNALTIPASESITFWLSYLDPNNFEPVPAQSLTSVRSSDWLTNAAEDGGGSDQTSASSASLTFFGTTAKAVVRNGTATDIYLTKFQIRGAPVERLANVAAETENASSQAVYGERSFDLDSVLLSDQNFLQDYADFLVERQKDADPSIALTLRNEFPDVIDREVEDNIWLAEDNTGVGQTFIIAGIEHIVTADVAGWIHETKFELEAFRDQEVLILDSEEFGKLDERKLGL